MLELKDITVDFLENAPKDKLIIELIELVRERHLKIKEETRFRKFEGACLNILSEFAPWNSSGREGKVLSALLGAIDDIQDSREGDP